MQKPGYYLWVLVRACCVRACVCVCVVCVCDRERDQTYTELSWLLQVKRERYNAPNEPPHDKTKKITCAPSEDSDQPGHPPSLIRVFPLHMTTHASLTTHLAHCEDSGQTRRMPRLIWVFAGRTCHFVGFVIRRLKLCQQLLPRLLQVQQTRSLQWTNAPNPAHSDWFYKNLIDNDFFFQRTNSPYEQVGRGLSCFLTV